MQRGRFLILIGVLLAVMALGLLLVLGRGDGEAEPTPTFVGDDGIVEPTRVPPTPTPIPNPVVVALQRIPRGTQLITSTVGLNEWVSIENWPQGWYTQDALTSFNQVVGKIVRSDIPRGTILTADMLTDQAGDLGAVGSDAALLIPPNRVGIAIPVDHVSSVGWALRRGDHVDILISFLFVELDEEFQTTTPNRAASLVRIEAEAKTVGQEAVIIQGTLGRIETDPFGQPLNVIPSNMQQRPRLVSQVTVRDVEVLNVGPWLPRGELIRTALAMDATGTLEEPTGEGEEATDGEEAPDDSGGDVEAVQQEALILSQTQAVLDLLENYSRQPVEPLLLVVSPQDALVLKWADEAGAAMHVVLRSYADNNVRLPDTEPVTLQYMVDMFNIALPPGLAYGVEPAVTELERSFLKLPQVPLNFGTPTIPQSTTTDEPPR